MPCADSPAVRSDEFETVREDFAKSVGENFESQDELTALVILEFEHAQLVGHEVEHHVVARELDVVAMKMKFTLFVADDVDSNG